MADSDNDNLDPTQAARLLEETRRDAKRQFNQTPLWLTVLMGLIILAAYGAIWLTTKSQDPYTGPSIGVVGLVYLAVVLAIGVSVTLYRRSTAGIRGPTVRKRQFEGLAVLFAYLGSPVLQGAMYNAGAPNAIVYGIIPAAAPLIIVGAAMVSIGATKQDWPQFGAALTAMAGGAIAAFVGPSAAWLVAGVGLFAAVLCYGIITAIRARHPRAVASA